ncbi:hypothetical protein D3C87_1986610 [compost metagenome]
MAEGGTRILTPCRSAGPFTGRVAVVICLKPLSQIFSKAKMDLLFAISPRMNAPRPPSMAFQTVS